MLTIQSLQRKFQDLRTDEVIDQALTKTVATFEKSQKEQLKAGKTKTGDKIVNKEGKGYRSKSYALRKHAINPLPGLGTPDLKLTGEFYRQIDVEAGANVFDIISKDEKGPMLENKYPGIFGLGGPYKTEYLVELRAKVNAGLSEKLGIKI